MTPEQYARIEEIFRRAIDLPAAPRNAYLDEACGGDMDLRAYVLNLLKADEVPESGGHPSDQFASLSVKECPACKRCYDDPIAVCPVDGQELQLAISGALLIDHKYKIERLIGRGAMGAVYLVNHVHLNKAFALKVISTGRRIPDYRRRNFETEAQLLARIEHPNIVGVTDSGIDPRGDGMPYLVMEYLEGRTVQQLLEEHQGALPFSAAIHLLRQMAEGIDAAHVRNIVHGDLKPANLFLAGEAGSGEILKIVDFGLARLTSRGEAETTRPTSAGIRGTPAYMARELLRGEDASPASDRYALGIIAYELLTGALPFGCQLDTIQENQRTLPLAPSVRNPRLPPELDVPILALLEPVPDKRPAGSVAAVAAIERAWLAAEQRQWRKRETPRRVLFAAIGSAAVILIASLAGTSTIGQAIEDRAVDARFLIMPPQPPDPRLLLVVLDEATLAQDSRPLGEWDTDFARMINQIFSGGARALAIDLLLPAKWSLSPEFGAAVTGHADHLALAKLSTVSGSVIGTECIGPLVAYAIGPERLARAFGFVNLDQDPDGGIREPRIVYLDRDGREQLSFAARAVLAASGNPSQIPVANRRIWIDYSTRPGSIPKLSWKDVAERLRASPGLFRNRLVIIGAEYAD